MYTAFKTKPVGRPSFPSSPPRSPVSAAQSFDREASRAGWLGDLAPELSCDQQREVMESRVTKPLPAQGWKRVFDVSSIVISLPFVLILMALIAVWIRLVSNGPALFRQERIGKTGKRFMLYKFRTMKVNSGTSRHVKHMKHLVESNSPMVKLDLLCDTRLIPGGCLLRAAGLDELPQLFNVLCGEMSLVGPRPCLPAEYAFFSSRQRERFKALPGLTGSWQVSGKNQTTFNEMNLLDIDYVRNASLLVDLRIIMQTPWTIICQMSEAIQQRLVVNRKNTSCKTVSETASACSLQRAS